jgi:NAD(P)-dependent dehydrogenase (short-subunit alcohol dehydrogenase family)
MGGRTLQLQNKVAVITGASLGIGSAIALAFAKEGAALAVDYRSHPDQAKQIVDEVEGAGGRAISVHADVSSPEDVKNLIRSAIEEFGRLDVMVNNAGMHEKMPFLDTPMDAPLKEDANQMQRLLSEIPLRRMGKPEEVAALAVYLASEDSAYVTGSTFVIDGGMMRHSGSL